ncbi:MAG: hypothetical protein JWQ72_1054, partial [Polaromonas sp.]|nr:hypothetical protein [Polaromonas sp.]
MVAEFAVFSVLALAAVGFGVYRFTKPVIAPARTFDQPPAPPPRPAGDNFKVSYVPPEFEWSGTASG